ncbi:MAG: hypothetical protein AVDCRST_MAG19-4186, partial [uncultured Thermomicrobiales bacterium]
ETPRSGVLAGAPAPFPEAVAARGDGAVHPPPPAHTSRLPRPAARRADPRRPRRHGGLRRPCRGRRPPPRRPGASPGRHAGRSGRDRSGQRGGRRRARRRHQTVEADPGRPGLGPRRPRSRGRRPAGDGRVRCGVRRRVAGAPPPRHRRRARLRPPVQAEHLLLAPLPGRPAAPPDLGGDGAGRVRRPVAPALPARRLRRRRRPPRPGVARHPGRPGGGRPQPGERPRGAAGDARLLGGDPVGPGPRPRPRPGPGRASAGGAPGGTRRRGSGRPRRPALPRPTAARRARLLPLRGRRHRPDRSGVGDRRRRV